MAGNIIGNIDVVCGDGISAYAYAWVDGNGKRTPGNGFTSRSSKQGTYQATNCDHFYIKVVNLATGYDHWEVDLDGLEFNSNTQVNWGYSDEGEINVRCTSSRGGTLTINGVKKSSTTYTLRFNANGGINPPASMEGDSNNNYTVTIPDSKPTWEGYTFVEWNTHPLGSGTAFRRKDPVHLDVWGNLTLYAQWEKNSVTGSIECIERTTTSLTFEWSKSSNLNGNIKLIHNGAESSTKSTGTGASGTVKFTDLDPGTLYMAELWCDGNCIAYCNGQTSSRPKSCTIYYEPNRPSDAAGEVTNRPADESFKDGQARVSGQPPECAGYRFKEWNTKKDGTGDVYSYNQGWFEIVSDITLYAQWEQNAKLAKPIVTKDSKDGTSITVKVNKNGGYGGYWEVTAWIDGEYTSTHRYSDEGSPFYITFGNLSPSTLYKIKAVHCVDGVGEKESETIRIRTNIPTFNWTADDSFYIKVGEDLSNKETSPLKAEKWNELTKLIQTCQTISLGGNTYFTSAAKGAEITAQIFNEVAYALGDLNGGVVPAKGEPVKVGEDILASYFAGNTKALKETINGISEEINKGT